MPLASGKGKKVIGGNIQEMLHKFKQTGKIGTSHPASMKKAQEQASAIAFETSRKSTRKKK